eukprot:14321517-Alexandrium_andersonii.AAC.1
MQDGLRRPWDDGAPQQLHSAATAGPQPAPAPEPPVTPRGFRTPRKRASHDLELPPPEAATPAELLAR